MAKRIVCCPADDGKLEYLYVDTSKLLVENISANVSVLVSDANERCCFNELSHYALGDKVLSKEKEDLFSFDFYKVNSFEMFKTTDELRLKTGSEKILNSCILNYYRREYDGTQQHTFFSEPNISNTFVDNGGGVEHELTLENRELIQNKKEEINELETLDKGKTDAEREAEAALAQAEAEQQAALADAEKKELKKSKQKKARARQQRILEEERYREFRNQDNVQNDEYRRLRQYEEEMRQNNAYLSKQYNEGNYNSLPGVVSNNYFADTYETVGKETLGIAVENRDLYSLASRMDEFGVPYTVMGETLADGRQISNILYSSDYAERASSAKDFFELEKNLHYDNVVNGSSYYNAFQLSALEYAYNNNVDVSYVSNGEYNANQMFRVIDAGLNGYDMSALANPAYSPAHMDALAHYMGNGWDINTIKDPGLSPSFIADNLLKEEMKHGIPHERSFFENHDYDGFLAYGSAGSISSFFNNYDNVQKERYYTQLERTSKDINSKESFDTFKNNLHNSYEQRQTEMNYLPKESNSPHSSNEVVTSEHSSQNNASLAKSDSDAKSNSKSNNGDKPYSFNSAYTLTGYNKSDSSFEPYNMPNRAAGPGGATGNGRGGPVATPPSKKIPFTRTALDDLKVRSEFAKKAGYAIHNYGSGIARASLDIVRNIANKGIQGDESGTMSGYHTITRTTRNVSMSAQLVMDLPRQFSRVGEKIKYGSASVAKACKAEAGKNYTYVSSKQFNKDIDKLERQQRKQLKKTYGAKAAGMNIREINSNISKFNKDKSILVNKRGSLRGEIQSLYNKKRSVGLSASEKKLLKSKLDSYSKITSKINKKAQGIKKLEKLKVTKKAHAKATNKLRAAANKLGKKEGNWKRAPGILTNSLVSQFNKAGNDNTLGGIATASNIAMSYLRSPLRNVIHGIGNTIIGKPLKKATRKLVRKTTTYKKYRLRRIKKTQRKLKKIRRRQDLIRKGKQKLKSKAEKVIGKKATKLITKFGKGTKKGFSVVSKIIGAPFKLINSITSFVKKWLLKICIWLGIGLLCVALLASIANALMSSSTSFLIVDEEDGKINLTKYINIVNESQQTLQSEIYSIASGTSASGKHYDNVFYDYNGSSGNNTAQILSMAYIRFDGLLENYPDEAKAYIQQLYKDSNYVDSAVSELYSCDNGCVTRNYFCYDKYDKFASTTRKSLYAASHGEGCKKSANYSCMEKTILGKHNNGAAMDSPCSCSDCSVKTNSVETGKTLYLCPGYSSGNMHDGTYVVNFHNNMEPMYSPCSCPNVVSQKEKITVKKYYCKGYTGKVYNKNGCKVHNNGKVMDSPCACGNYKETLEKKQITEYFCQRKKHNDGLAMSNPCSCEDCKSIKRTVDIKHYYCQGYCPGEHYIYTCGGHKEQVCYGEHQDITITITSLDFDDIFYADSSVAQTGSSVRGEAYANNFNITAYCSCKKCCGEYSPEVTGKPSTTATGTTPKANHTLAVDYKNPVVPLGTHVWIDGREYVVEDTGDLAVRGVDFDMYFNSHQAALQWGKRSKTVYKNVLVSEEDSVNLTADKYGFKGWTKENIEIAKNIYAGLVGDEAKEVYKGLEYIRNLKYASTNSAQQDFSNIEFDTTSGLTSNQQKIITVIKNNNLATVSGRCQAWVADVYQAALGGARTSRCCANHAGEAWGASNDWSKIQVGATVYGYSSSKYGHVGIYIGDGKVAHNIGYLKIQSLESWVNTYNGQCWGWNGGKNLTGNSQYNCKPAGTFMYGKD